MPEEESNMKKFCSKCQCNKNISDFDYTSKGDKLRYSCRKCALYLRLYMREKQRSDEYRCVHIVGEARVEKSFNKNCCPVCKTGYYKNHVPKAPIEKLKGFKISSVPSVTSVV